MDQRASCQKPASAGGRNVGDGAARRAGRQRHLLRVEEFSNALLKVNRSFFPYKIDLKQLDIADNFIDADSFKNDMDFENLLKKIVKPLVPFTKIDVNKISLSDGNNIMQSFLQELPKLSNPFNTFTIRQLRLQLTR